MIRDMSSFTSYSDIAIWLGLRPRDMTFCARHTEDHVQIHKIVTNHGTKERTIYAPSRILKHVQQSLKTNIFDKLDVDDVVHGFVAGRGCRTNAASHGGGLVVNIDMKDFFPSITTERVYGMWSRAFKALPKTAWLLTHVTTFDGHLCQGFVTSPQIANAMAWSLDKRLTALADKFNFVYTRYADDLTFSRSAWAGDCRWLIDATRDIVEDEGFKVNEKKVAIMRPHRRQIVTGLIVNEPKGVDASKCIDGPRIPKFDLRWLRAACDQWQRKAGDERANILGWISYVHSVQPQRAQALRDLIAKREGQEKKAWEATRPSP